MKRQPTFIDLFCGCGGWTEGFSQLSYKCLYSVDFWAPAALTHSVNHPGIEDDKKAKNILDSSVAETIKTKLRSGEVDVLIGSPPCTQFSFSNRGGSGDVVEGMVLVRRFLEFVDYIQNELSQEDYPWVMENVPRLKVFLEKECIDKKNSIYRLNCVDEPEIFYEVKIPKIVVLNSADYGAPQKRQRVFCGNFSIPKPTHISPGVLNDSAKRREFIQNYELDEGEFKNLKPWRTLDRILDSLPNPQEKLEPDVIVTDPNYPNLRITANELHDHFYDTRLHAGVELFECHEMKQHHPVYGVMNFPDDTSQPARTVMATEMAVSRETIVVPVKKDFKPERLGKRPYIEVLNEHRDKKSGGYRRLTIRELGCVQGFPITYQLSGMTSGIKHKQIGNAVSPFISRAFAGMFAERYLDRPSIAKRSASAIRLNQPSDIAEHESYEHAHEWTPRPYKKNSQKFYAHLRTTKADGQRLDLAMSPNDRKLWKPLLCLGSGKAYRRTEIGYRLLDEMLSGLKRGQNRINGELDEWLSNIEKEINSADMNRFTSASIENNFDKGGDIVKGTPIYFVEDGLDLIIRDIVNGSYNELRTVAAEVEFSEFGVSRPINAYTVIAAVALEQLVRRANASSIT